MNAGHAIQQTVLAVARAAQTLDPAQGRIARRNARARVAAAIRSLRAAVDKGFPAPPRLVARQPARGGTIGQQRARAHARLTRGGYVELDALGQPIFVTACATVGIRLRRPAFGGYFVPRWAHAVWNLPITSEDKIRRLREARRSTQAKRAALAEYMLAVQPKAP